MAIGLADMTAGSSPLTRGAPHPVKGRLTTDRLIPAYAGSTEFLECPIDMAGAHPRLRGEH